MSGPGEADGPWVTVSYTLRVNGADRAVEDVWLGESLLDVLRDRLGLVAAKESCGEGHCGTCTVLLGGRPVAACVVPAATAGPREVVTLEGLSAGGPTGVQRALIEHGAVQCGFCVPGLAVTAHALLAGDAAPGEDELRDALDGHPCRCAGPGRAMAALRELAARADRFPVHSRAPGPGGSPDPAGAPEPGPADPVPADPVPAAGATAPAARAGDPAGTTGEFRVVLSPDTATTGEFRIVVPQDVSSTGSMRVVVPPGEARRGRGA